jgi:hypothetical protein
MIFRPSSEFPQTVSQYLLPHEKQVIAVHKHPAVFAVHCSILAAACAAASLLTIIASSGELVLGIAWGICFSIFLWLVIRVVTWSDSYFAVTSARMIFITGLVVRKAITVPIQEIHDLSFHRSWPGRLLGYGIFIADQATYSYRIPSMNYMPYPEQLYLDVCGVLFPDDEEDSQERGPEDSS